MLALRARFAARHILWRSVLGCLSVGLGLAIPAGVTAGDRLEFNRDIRPILSDKCFRCHGQDAHSRQAELRLDQRESAVAVREGGAAVVPGRPEASELVRRIETADADEQMPPVDSLLSLSDEEKALLRQWIAEGAEYQGHWSWKPPERPPLPAVTRAAWPRNAIDFFVLAKLEELGAAPSAEASREVWLRRVSFDLTGLPPSLEALDSFLADEAPDAYERAVDRLLASERFGERMAVEWLDAARFADTNGYFGDKTRSVWPWRDWVIAAYNQNMPYDEFTIRQLAGDLLPAPTIEDRIATGFNRNHMANNETGIVDEEYRVEYVADRLETTAAVWLGLTVGCARCHDHKYDPISQREFYQLFAFFNNGPEAGLITADNPPPVIEVPSPFQERELARLTQRRQEAEQAYRAVGERLQAEVTTWETTATDSLALAPQAGLATYWSFDDELTGTVSGTNVKYERGVLGTAAVFDATQHAELPLDVDLDQAWTLSLWAQATGSLGCLLSKIQPDGDRRGLEVLWQKGRFQIHLVHRWGASALSLVTRDPLPSGVWHQLVLRYDGSGRAAGLSVFVNGKPAEVSVQLDTLDGSLRNSEPLRIARRDAGLGFYGKLDELRLLQGTQVTEAEVSDWYWGERLRGILAVPVAERSSSEQELLLDYFAERHAAAGDRDARRRLSDARRAESAYRGQIPTALVMQELAEPRTTKVLERGEYQRPGEAVEPDVPEFLLPWLDGAPRNRLGLARWLVSPDHSLTSRVAVNRLWMQCFGDGLVRTVNDYGSQGEFPSHPELLDWLAREFVRSGWDVKALLRMIVTSATYRQSSEASELLLARDRENRWLARGPRFRMSAEMIRDQALFASGLLEFEVGGPSVKPYQPPGLWEAVSYNGDESYEADRGPGLWRRSLYTFVKRQAPPPMLLAFDGPTREKCSLLRPRTNTPLQALVLLNDVTFVEAARGLAAQALAESSTDVERLQWAFRKLLTRPAGRAELAVLSELLEKQRHRFRAHPEAARQLTALGESTMGRERDVIALAAWTATFQVLFNLDEAITRR